MQKFQSKPRVAAKLAAFALSALLLVTPAFAAGKQDFTLHNKTGKVISELYLSPHDEESWEEDVMGDEVLGDEEDQDITFDRDEQPDAWDMKVVFDDGKSLVWPKLMLTNITDITIFYKNGKPFATWKLVQ